MTDKELADELDAQKRILAHGYTKENCPTCKGTGWLVSEYLALANKGRKVECFACGGKGYKWKAPGMTGGGPP